jgi:hypothetical protein
MPDHGGDDPDRGHRLRAAVALGLHETDGPVEAWMRRLPELRVLLEGDPDLRSVVEALVRAAARLSAELVDDDKMARRLVDAIERKTTPGADPKWGRKLSLQNMVRLMTEEIAGQLKPNAAAAARAVAAREPEAVTAEAVRQAWMKHAIEQGLSGAELAQRVWEEARGRAGQPS